MKTIKTVDEVRAHLHEVAAIHECYSMIRDELLKAAREHGHEEYKDGLYRAMQLLMLMHNRREEIVGGEIEDWAIAARREIRISDPRGLPSVVVH